MSDITISYNGSAIATMDASGTKTLETEGKYCKDDITLVYVRPSGVTPTGTINITSNGTVDVTQYAYADVAVPTITPPKNIIANGDFSVSGATTTGWKSINPYASIAISGGKLVLTHNTTSNMNYGVAYKVNTTSGHTYLIKYKMTKTMLDSDADARGIAVWFGGTADQEADVARSITQNTVVERVCACKANASRTLISFTFLGSVSTTASSDSMMEFDYVEMYDITDVIP